MQAALFLSSVGGKGIRCICNRVQEAEEGSKVQLETRTDRQKQSEIRLEAGLGTNWSQTSAQLFNPSEEIDLGGKAQRQKAKALSLDVAGIWGQMEENGRAVTSALVSESCCHVPVNV